MRLSVRNHRLKAFLRRSVRPGGRDDFLLLVFKRQVLALAQKELTSDLLMATSVRASNTSACKHSGDSTAAPAWPASNPPACFAPHETLECRSSFPSSKHKSMLLCPNVFLCTYSETTLHHSLARSPAAQSASVTVIGIRLGTAGRDHKICTASLSYRLGTVSEPCW